MRRITPAHCSLPPGTTVEVYDLQRGRRVVVRINDRGLYVDRKRRIIELSRATSRRSASKVPASGACEVWYNRPQPGPGTWLRSHRECPRYSPYQAGRG